MAPDSSNKAFDLPGVPGISKTYFLRLQLHDATGALVSDNFYWLSTKPDPLDWAHKQDTVYTPQKDFGELERVGQLAASETGRHGDIGWQPAGAEAVAHQACYGQKSKLEFITFMAHLRLTRVEDGADVVPVLWEDNYFSLLPGETPVVLVSFPDAGQPVAIEVDGYNVTPQTLNP